MKIIDKTLEKTAGAIVATATNEELLKRIAKIDVDNFLIRKEFASMKKLNESLQEDVAQNAKMRNEFASMKKLNESLQEDVAQNAKMRNEFASMKKLIKHYKKISQKLNQRIYN